MPDPVLTANKLAAEMLRRHATWHFFPARWGGVACLKTLRWSKPIKWTGKPATSLPLKPGVYAFLLIPDLPGSPDGVYVLYIGMTSKQTIRQRYADYVIEAAKSRGRLRIRNMFLNWPKHLWYTYALTTSADAGPAEVALRSALIPPFNNDIAADINAARKAFAY